MLACINGNTDTINVLLNAGADPNIADADGDTWLHYAARNYCHMEVVQAIISHGVDVNITNKMNITALMIACKEGNKEAINVLLNAGADHNIADAYGHTWLHYAARNYRQPEVLQTIINHGVDVNVTNEHKITALMLACEKGNKDVINILLDAGADHNITDAYGDTWLHYAARNYWHPEVLHSLISHGVGVNATNRKNITAFMTACAKGNKDIINVLLNAGADPDKADTDGDTCLHYAARHYCHMEVVQALISHGIDVNVTNKKNVTSLMISCRERNKDDVDVLLNAGADPNIADDDGDTCLHKILHREYLSLEYDHETLQMLLDHGAPVNAANKNHQTAYMLACDQGNIDAMYALLNAGADPSITNNDNGDANHQYMDNSCANNVTMQTAMQWLNPAWHYLYLPELDITESLSFNLISHIICNMMRHAIYRISLFRRLGVY